LFARAGIDLNIQLVLCPGWNDGGELRFSLEELRKLPTARSIAAVPVGLTRYRENLAALRPFTKEEAWDVIKIFDEFRCGNIEVCASDEFFLLAEQEMPGTEYYGEFRQIENGVGLWASFREDVLDALGNYPLFIGHCSLTLATGAAAYPLLRFLVDECEKIWHNIHIDVRPVENRFFGAHITVAGLLTGRDVVEQLQGGALGERLLLPAAMFNLDGLTLDGMTIEDISRALGVPAKIVKNDADEFLKAIAG
jgi:NifB/MoaA-like Fe-S oxidoreductase